MPMYSFSSRSKTSTFSAHVLTWVLVVRHVRAYCLPYPAAWRRSGRLAGAGPRAGFAAGRALVRRRGRLVPVVVVEWHCIHLHILHCRVSCASLCTVGFYVTVPIEDDGRPGASTASSDCPGSCSERCSMALKSGAAFGGAPAGPPWGWRWL
jgi:hypothetical protein